MFYRASNPNSNHNYCNKLGGGGVIFRKIIDQNVRNPENNINRK